MDSPEQKFFVSDDGKERLSITKAELQAGIDSGKYGKKTLGWTKGMNEWLPLSDPSWEKHGIKLFQKPTVVPKLIKAAPPFEPSFQKPHYKETPPPSPAHGAVHHDSDASGSARTCEMALASLLCGIALVPILPVLLGHIAIARINKSQGAMTGKGLAVGGLALGYLCLVTLLVSGGIVAYNFEDFFGSSQKKTKAYHPEFTSLEFDSDESVSSPAEVHSMNQHKELKTVKERLLERESELDSRESAIAMDLEALEKKKRELDKIQENLTARLTDFEANQGQGTSEAKLKQYKETAKRWVEMGPKGASMEIQNLRQKRRFEEALSIFEQLKAEEKAPIIAFMLNSDVDALIELADALAMRDRGLLPSLDLTARSTEFETTQGQDISEVKLKEYKETAKRWVQMGPKGASMEIQNLRQKRRFEEALSIFEQLKAEEKAPIIAFMLNSDDDALIELADALAMRDRGLLPSMDPYQTTPKGGL